MSPGSRYKHIKEIAQLVRWQLETTFDSLEGLGDIAAETLYKHLQENNVECELVEGVFLTDMAIFLCKLGPFEHHWVEIDGFIIDVIADIFNPAMDIPFPKMFIGQHGQYMRS